MLPAYPIRYPPNFQQVFFQITSQAPRFRLRYDELFHLDVIHHTDGDENFILFPNPPTASTVLIPTASNRRSFIFGNDLPYDSSCDGTPDDEEHGSWLSCVRGATRSEHGEE